MKVCHSLAVLFALFLVVSCGGGSSSGYVGGNEITTPPGPDMVYLEGVTFVMGSSDSEHERFTNELQHQVTISPFWINKYEVTQAEWMEVMGSNPSYFKGDNLPVEMVSWYEVIEYCNKRSIQEGLTPAYTIDKSRKDRNNTNTGKIDQRWVVTWNHTASGYRLPTEAEWEYAARAGTTTPFSTGESIATHQANYDGRYYNPTTAFLNTTTAVGNFAPNPWGLYDMHGNVYEWCWDWHGSYSADTADDPTGAISGDHRIIRGGSWLNDERFLRSAYRGASTPSLRYNDLGFRVVRSK